MEKRRVLWQLPFLYNNPLLFVIPRAARNLLCAFRAPNLELYSHLYFCHPACPGVQWDLRFHVPVEMFF
jgi:hypothetical protein